MIFGVCAKNYPTLYYSRGFLDTVNFISRFIHDFSTITAHLTQHRTKWQWTKQHQNGFTRLKHQLTISPTIAYFDPTKNTELVVDTSPVVLGAILTQKTVSLTNDTKTKILA